MRRRRWFLIPSPNMRDRRLCPLRTVLQRRLRSMPHRLLEQLEAHARQQPAATAVTSVAPACSAERSLTYSQLHEAVLRCAASLERENPSGGVVLLCAPNQPQLVIAFLAVLAANLTV